MKRIAIVLVVFSLLSLSSAELAPVPCEDWYDFGSLEFEAVSLDYPLYYPGETVEIWTAVTNTNPYPIVEGSIRAHVIYVDGEEEYILDEFYLADDINLLPGEKAEFRGERELPENLKSGDYSVAVYFITSDNFNLAGVSFLREIYGRMTSFKVAGGGDLLHFDTAQLKINGEPQSLHEPSKLYNEGTAITVDIPLKNEGEATEAAVRYDLYAWDDLREEDLIETKEENLQLASGESKDLRYVLPATTPQGTYSLVITADSGKNNAIVKIRLPIMGRMIKTNFAGIDSFPLQAGKPVKLFMCVSNAAQKGIDVVTNDELGSEDVEPTPSGLIKDADLRLSVEADGKMIFSDSLEGASLGGLIEGYETEFTPEDEYKLITLVAEAEDEAGNSERFEIVYDYDKLYKDVDLSMETSVNDQSVDVSLTLEKEGKPAPGRVNVYVKDEDGAVINLESDIEVWGDYETSFELSPGEYLIRAMELTTWASAEEEVLVEAYSPIPPALPDEEPAMDYTPFVLILLVVLFALVVFLMKRKNG